jgi:zinc and cadmium transporter
LSATLAILGAIFSYFLISRLDNLTDFLIMLTAGGFIYISASDLIPELHREPILKKSISSFIFFVMGIIFMYIVKIVFEA